MNLRALRAADTTLLFLSKVAEICFVAAIVFAFATLLWNARLLKDIEL